MNREFLVGGKESGRMSEDGLGAGWLICKSSRVHPLKCKSLMGLDKVMIVKS